MPDYERTKQRLEAVGQAHVLHFYDQLPPDGQRRLLEQLDRLDLESLRALVYEYVQHKPALVPTGELHPATYYPADPASPRRPWDRDRYRAIGADLLRAGKVAVFTVAGGQ